MKNNRSLEIKVGIVAFIGIALFVIGLSIGKGVNVNTGKPEITMHFPSSGGIVPAAPVVVNGVERGKVLKVKNENDKVTITAVLDYVDDFYADASAKITILEITGGKKIQINPGTSGKFNTSLPILGETPPDIADLVMILGNVSGDAVNLVKRLDTALIAVNVLLTDEKFINDIKVSMNNVNEITTNLDSFIDNNYSELELTIANLQELSNDLKNTVNNNEPKISKIIDDLDATLASADKLIYNANSAINDFDVVAKDLQDISKAIINNDGILNKLIYDQNFSAQLDSTMIKLSELLNIIHEHGVNVNLRIGTRP